MNLGPSETRAGSRLPRPLSRAGRRIGALVLLGATVALLVASDTLHDGLMAAVAAVEPAVAGHPVVGGAAFVLWCGISAMLAFVSSGVLVPAAVYAWGPAVTLALLWVGWILGGIAAYAVGRYLGRPVVHALVRSDVLGRYERRFAERPSFGLVVLFQVALPSEMLGYMLGLVRYPFALFAASLALVQLPYAVGTVYFSAALLERRLGLLLTLGAAALLITAWALRILRRRLRDQPADPVARIAPADSGRPSPNARPPREHPVQSRAPAAPWPRGRSPPGPPASLPPACGRAPFPRDENRHENRPNDPEGRPR